MVKFLLEIITPHRRAFAEEVETVTVPTSRGTIGVLDRHVPLFSALTEGEIKIKSGNKEYFLATGGGFMEVRPEGVTILASSAAHAHELNEAEIKRAIESAKTLLARRVQGQELASALLLLRRSTIELKVVRRRRTYPHIVSAL